VWRITGKLAANLCVFFRLSSWKRTTTRRGTETNFQILRRSSTASSAKSSNVTSGALLSSVVGSVAFCLVVIEASTLVSIATDSVVPVFAAESTGGEAFQSNNTASNVLGNFASTVFWLNVIGDVVESIEVEPSMTNNAEILLEEDEVDLEFDSTDSDLAADFVVGSAVGLEVDLGIILAVAQPANWSEVTECQQKRQLEMARQRTYEVGS
jgi:hypothetical protein